MSENIALLINKSDEFLKDAAILLQNNGYSSTVSRSYYAMFHAAQAVLLSENIIAHTHKGVMLNFSNIFVKNNRFSFKLGKSFAKIQDKREQSDYEIGFRATFEQADEILRTALNPIMVKCPSKQKIMSTAILFVMNILRLGQDNLVIDSERVTLARKFPFPTAPKGSNAPYRTGLGLSVDWFIQQNI